MKKKLFLFIIVTLINSTLVYPQTIKEIAREFTKEKAYEKLDITNKILKKEKESIKLFGDLISHSKEVNNYIKYGVIPDKNEKIIEKDNKKFINSKVANSKLDNIMFMTFLEKKYDLKEQNLNIALLNIKTNNLIKTRKFPNIKKISNVNDFILLENNEIGILFDEKIDENYTFFIYKKLDLEFYNKIKEISSSDVKIYLKNYTYKNDQTDDYTKIFLSDKLINKVYDSLNSKKTEQKMLIANKEATVITNNIDLDEMKHHIWIKGELLKKEKSDLHYPDILYAFRPLLDKNNKIIGLILITELI